MSQSRLNLQDFGGTNEEAEQAADARLVQLFPLGADVAEVVRELQTTGMRCFAMHPDAIGLPGVLDGSQRAAARWLASGRNVSCFQEFRRAMGSTGWFVRITFDEARQLTHIESSRGLR